MAVLGAESLGERIRRLREQKGLTQAQLAQPRFTGAYISQIEAGKRRPSPAALRHLGKKLAVDQDELITGRPHNYRATLELSLSSATEELFKGEFATADKQLNEVLDEARSLDLMRIQARAEEMLGISAERQGNSDIALDHFERALELWEGEPVSLHVEAVVGIARATHLLGDVRYAVHILETYLSRLKRLEAPGPHALMRTYSSLVGRYFGAGLPSKAIDAAREALALEPEIDKPQALASMYLNSARALLHEGRPEDAMDALRRAHDLFMAVGRPQDAAYAQIAQGIVLADDGKLDEARKTLLGSLAQLDAADLDKARSLNELGRVERLRGEKAEAERLLREAAPLLEESNIQELAMNKRELGATLFATDPQVGEKHLRDAIELYLRSENPIGVASTYKMLGQALKEAGDVASAHAALVTGIEYLERTR
ncbi:MAG: helix-turn-helix domain-containing protein [Actinomycetota bacterium]